MLNCKDCRYWSELVAEVSNGTLKALCLNSSSPQHSKLVPEHSTCKEVKPSYGYAIDDPKIPENWYEDVETGGW